jgi:hypothetical protein
MPLHEFICPDGHRVERLVAVGAEYLSCECGKLGRRNPVNRVAQARRWGSDFVVPHDARQAIDESVGYKKEAVAEMEEAVANGFGV